MCKSVKSKESGWVGIKKFLVICHNVSRLSYPLRLQMREASTVLQESQDLELWGIEVWFFKWRALFGDVILMQNILSIKFRMYNGMVDSWYMLSTSVVMSMSWNKLHVLNWTCVSNFWLWSGSDILFSIIFHFFLQWDLFSIAVGWKVEPIMWTEGISFDSMDIVRVVSILLRNDFRIFLLGWNLKRMYSFKYYPREMRLIKG